MLYLFISLSLCACSTLFSSISATFREEPVLSHAPIHSTAYHNSAGCNMEDRNTTSDDELIAWKLGDYRGKIAWLAHG